MADETDRKSCVVPFLKPDLFQGVIEINKYTFIRCLMVYINTTNNT